VNVARIARPVISGEKTEALPAPSGSNCAAVKKSREKPLQLPPPGREVAARSAAGGGDGAVSYLTPPRLLSGQPSLFRAGLYSSRRHIDQPRAQAEAPKCRIA
jgi:hypothetical protein